MEVEEPIYFNSAGMGRAKKENSWLSNFYPVEVENDFGEVMPSVEAAFQSSKFMDADHRRLFLSLPAWKAKHLGRERHPSFRRDWGTVSYRIMCDLQVRKYSRSPLREMLLATGERYLVEDAYWERESLWGIGSSGRGQNLTGRSIMLARQALHVEL